MNTVMERTGSVSEFLRKAQLHNQLVRVFIKFDGCQAHYELRGHIVDLKEYPDGNHYLSMKMAQGTVVSFLTEGDGWTREFERVEYGMAPRDLECINCSTLKMGGDTAHLVYAIPGALSSHEELRGFICKRCLAGGQDGR